MKISRRGLTAEVKKKLHQKACRTCSAIIFAQSTNQIIDPKTSELSPREAKPPLFFHQIRSPRANKYYFQHQDLHLIIITHHPLSSKSGSTTTASNKFPVQNISFFVFTTTKNLQ